MDFSADYIEYDFEPSRITNKAVEYLSNCVNLEHVIFTGCDQLTNVALEFILKCPRLEYASFFKCEQIPRELQIFRKN